MKTITTTALLTMSLDPIFRAISRAIVRRKVSSLDNHIASLQIGIKNDLRAVGELQKERALLARRLS